MCQYKLEKNSVKQNKWLKMKINTLLNMKKKKKSNCGLCR